MSPLLEPDLSGTAPAYVVVAGFDPLRDEGEAYAKRLTEAGVPTQLAREGELIHGFVSMTRISPGSRAATLRRLERYGRRCRTGLRTRSRSSKVRRTRRPCRVDWAPIAKCPPVLDVTQPIDTSHRVQTM